MSARTERGRSSIGASVLRLPRLLRILLAALFAFGAALLLDRVFAPTYYAESGSSTFTVSVVVGLIMYVVGWWLMIGFGESPPRPRPLLNLYVVGSLVVIVAAVIMVAISLISTFTQA